jgi:predicted small lipoprotein YifL
MGIKKCTQHKVLFLFTAVLATLTTAGCGQRSSLYMPNDEESKNKASLIQIITPSVGVGTNKADKAQPGSATLKNQQASPAATGDVTNATTTPKPTE